MPAQLVGGEQHYDERTEGSDFLLVSASKTIRIMNLFEIIDKNQHPTAVRLDLHL